MKATGKTTGKPNNYVAMEGNNVTRLCSLIRYQGTSQPVNTSGIIVRIDKDSVHITDPSRGDSNPIQVERNGLELVSQNEIGQRPSIKTDQLIKKGDRLLLHRYIVDINMNRACTVCLRRGIGSWSCIEM